MAIAAREGLPVYQLDVVAAYLNGNLKEEIYIELPEYISEILAKIVNNVGENSELRTKAANMLRQIHEGDKVCLLQKALYGLRQAGREWNKILDGVLRGLGLSAALNDTCFYFDPNEEEFTLLVVYVDDILYVSKSETKLKEIRAKLQASFEIKDLGLASSCLGIQIEQKNGEIRLNQKLYVRSVLKRFNMDESNPVNTPAELKAKTIPRVNKTLEHKQRPYRQLIGSLMYLAVATRPDLAFVVNRLAQFNQTHDEQHWSAAKRVLRYLQGTLDQGLVYAKNSLGITGYSDAQDTYFC